MCVLMHNRICNVCVYEGMYIVKKECVYDVSFVCLSEYELLGE